MKCGFFQIEDMFYDEPGYDCKNEATHTSCNYGNVCKEHTCRCSKNLGEVMKKEVEQKLNRYEDVGGKTVVTRENLPIEKSTRKPIEGEVDLESFIEDSDGGFRVRWTRGNYGAVVEEKVGDEWKPIGGIQKLTIEFDAKESLPMVKIERYIT
jgi:hypothetical protein